MQIAVTGRIEIIGKNVVGNLTVRIVVSGFVEQKSSFASILVNQNNICNFEQQSNTPF
jgi:hypothetical protein